MKNKLIVLLFIGAISATQLETLKRQHQRRVQVRRHQPLSNQERLYSLMALKGSTLGAFDETDTADYWKQLQQEHSSDDYVDETPEAYAWVNGDEDIQLNANNLMRAPSEGNAWGNKHFPNWGDLQAAKDDHVDAIKDSQGTHSSEEYVPDAPQGDYAEAVDYDVLQLKQHLELTQKTLPENWGNLAIGQEEHRSFIHDFVEDHADEDDYKEDAPDSIPVDILEYNLQLNSKINRNFNNVLLAIAEPNESGIDTDTHGSDSYEQHADEDDYKQDAPAETNIPEIIGEYAVQLRSNTGTLPENWGDLAFNQEKNRETIHGNVVDHADEDDYKDDSPAETNTAEILGAYDVQLASQIRTLPENWGDLAFNVAEHREKLFAGITEHADEDDYKDDAPVDTAKTEIIGEYDLQLHEQGMSVAEALIKKWGEIPYEDTPEFIKSNMLKRTDAEQFYEDIPVDYLEPVQNAQAHIAV